MIIGVCLARASVAETTKLLGYEKNMVSIIMKAYTKDKITSSKQKWIDKDTQVLKCISSWKKQSIAIQNNIQN